MNPSRDPAQGRSARFGGERLHALLAALLILAIGLTAAFEAKRWMEADIAADSAERLDRLASRIRTTIGERFRMPVYGLRGLKSAMAVRGRLTRGEFRDVIETRDMPAEFPGVGGFGFAERVARTSAREYEELIRHDGSPDFTVRTTGDAADLYVVKFIEPLASNARALGYDIGSEATRRAAIESAIESGGPALTGTIALVQESRQRPGFLLMIPLYAGGSMPAATADRHAAARGVLYVPMIADDIVGNAPAAADHLVEFDMFDGIPDNTLAPFYSFRTPGSPVPVSAAAPAGRRAFVLPLFIADRLITIRAWGSPGWEAQIDRTTPQLLFAGLAAFSVLLAFAIWLLATGRARALALARGMTAELDRLAAVAERTTNGVIIADAERRIVWVNEGFTRLTGYTPAEAIGRKPRELVQYEGTSTAEDDEMRRCFAERRPFRGEIRNRAKDGRLYWVDLEIRPMFGRSGAFTGYMAIQAEITERKEAYERLERHEAELQKAFVEVEAARNRAEHQATEMAALAEQLKGERHDSELSRQRLAEAIESLSDAFCLYDPDGRIVIYNTEYTDTYASFADLIRPGTSYELIVRLGIERGLYPAAAGREEDFVREHLEEFRNPRPPYEVRSPEGKWYRITKKRTPTGHTISFRIDITELKAKEAALAKLNGELERLAATDSLTGVPNRRSLMERGRVEILRLKRHGGTTAFLALDIDHFKRVNDTHGHAAGDRVLVEFASRVRACLRETDIFGRVGGEEFAIVATNTDIDGAKLLGERLLEFVRSRPVDCEGTQVSVTTSVGISMLAPTDADLSDAQGRADEALYRAKRNGRDRLEIG